MAVREMKPGEAAAVMPLILDLWPDAGDYEFTARLNLVWEDAGRIGGFAIVDIRPYSNACEGQPCPHLEGWYVEPDLRYRGVGRALIEAAEDWCRREGFTELGSDVLLNNAVSLQAHESLGFMPIEKVQYFRKAL